MARLIEGSYELSLDEIKGLTGWPDEMAEDYSSTQRQTRKTLDDLDQYAVQINTNKTKSETNETNIAADFKYLHGTQSKSTAFSATSSYNKYDLVTHDGVEYSAKQAITPAAFNATQWRKVSTVDNNKFINEHIDATDPHPQYGFREPTLYLFGNADDFTLDTTAVKVANYTNNLAAQGALIAGANKTTGVITVPAAGTYTVKLYLRGTVAGISVNHSALLHLDVNGTKPIVDRLDISKLEETNIALSAEFTRTFAANDAISMWASSTISFGSFTTEHATIEVKKIG